MSKALYVPAIGEQFNSVWKRGLDYKGKDMKFFTEKSHFNHCIGLQSCYYGINGVGKRVDTNFRDMIGFPKDKILVGDSGGFQIASFKIKGEKCNLTPLESLRWQEENCDVGMNLDVPPTLGKVAVYGDFMKALDESYENFKLFERERKNFDMKLLNVLHGENIELMDIWYNKVKDCKFDGWAVGMKPPFDPMIQAMGFMYLWDKGEFKKDSCKWIHFFGTSGKHVVPAIVYMASKVGVPVSYDSSSYNIGSIYRTFYSPFDMGPHLSFGEKFKIKNPNIKKLPCNCPVCQTVEDIEDLNKTDIYAGTLISLHNMYQYVYYNDVLNNLVDEKELFLEYLKNINISEKTLKSIEFIDHAIEFGLRSAVSVFKQYLIPQDLDKTKQGGIFDF